MRRGEKLIKILCVILAVAICVCLITVGVTTNAFQLLFDRDNQKKETPKTKAALSQLCKSPSQRIYGVPDINNSIINQNFIVYPYYKSSL